jgi:hypothetical protein
MLNLGPAEVPGGVMKAVCSRHEQAYEVGIGCPWCEAPQESAKPVASVYASLARPMPAGFDSSRASPPAATPFVAPVALNESAPAAGLVPCQGFDSRKLTVDDMMRLARFYAL